jgi:hypothetical protein
MLRLEGKVGMIAVVGNTLPEEISAERLALGQHSLS